MESPVLGRRYLKMGWFQSCVKKQNKTNYPHEQEIQERRLIETRLHIQLPDVVSRRKVDGFQKVHSSSGRREDGLGTNEEQNSGWTGKTPEPWTWLLDKVMSGLLGTGLLKSGRGSDGGFPPSVFSGKVCLLPDLQPDTTQHL